MPESKSGALPLGDAPLEVTRLFLDFCYLFVGSNAYRLVRIANDKTVPIARFFDRSWATIRNLRKTVRTTYTVLGVLLPPRTFAAFGADKVIHCVVHS